MPRGHLPASYASHDGAILPKSGQFVANRDKVIDHPRPAVFSIGGKKMFSSPTAPGVGQVLFGAPAAPAENGHTNGNGASVQRTHNGAHSDVAGLYSQRLPSPTGKRMISVPDAAFGAVPQGAASEPRKIMGGSRAHVSSPVSRHQEDFPCNRRMTHVINSTNAAEFTAVCAKRNSVPVMYDHGKRTSNRPETAQQLPPTPEKLQNSQRYSTTPLKSAETIGLAQPAHKSSVVINSGRHQTKTLVGVMKADPPPRPTSTPKPAPWAQGSDEPSPPKGRRASPFRPAETDGFTAGGHTKITGLRHVSPMSNSLNERDKPAGRRHSPYQRSISPFALHD